MLEKPKIIALSFHMIFRVSYISQEPIYLLLISTDTSTFDGFKGGLSIATLITLTTLISTSYYGISISLKKNSLYFRGLNVNQIWIIPWVHIPCSIGES